MFSRSVGPQEPRKLPFTICPFPALSAGRLLQEIDAIKEQLSDEPLQGGEAAAAPYGQRARVTPDRLAFVIREQWKTFNRVRSVPSCVMR